MNVFNHNAVHFAKIVMGKVPNSLYSKANKLVSQAFGGASRHAKHGNRRLFASAIVVKPAYVANRQPRNKLSRKGLVLVKNGGKAKSALFKIHVSCDSAAKVTRADNYTIVFIRDSENFGNLLL